MCVWDRSCICSSCDFIYPVLGPLFSEPRRGNKSVWLSMSSVSTTNRALVCQECLQCTLSKQQESFNSEITGVRKHAFHRRGHFLPSCLKLWSVSFDINALIVLFQKVQHSHQLGVWYFVLFSSWSYAESSFLWRTFWLCSALMLLFSQLCGLTWKNIYKYLIFLSTKKNEGNLSRA